LFCVMPGGLNEMGLFWEREFSDLFQTQRIKQRGFCHKITPQIERRY